jgi:MraZ protein
VVYYGGRALGREIPRFVGSVEHALDEKGRLVVPIRFRERLGVEFILTIAQPDPCLALYPAATWDRVCERLEAAPVKDQGYREDAGIERACVLIGSLTRVEIWAKERLGSLQSSADEAEDFSTELGLF